MIQDGDLDVSGGGHGIDITGDSATVDNKGTMTVTDPESIGIQIDGDKAVVNNEGESTITNGGTGTQINGDDATANNTGKTTVDGRIPPVQKSTAITETLFRTAIWMSAAVVTVLISPATARRWITRAP